MDNEPDNAAPLTGIKVIEMGGSVAVPYGCWILATLGATVIKVERPETGDDARTWIQARYEGISTLFLTLNAGKHSVTVDLKDEEQLKQLRQYIIDEADVVIQNLRPGVADSLGIGADEMIAANPKLIYCNSGSFGATGPLAMQPGYDPLMQAFCGLMNVTGHEGQPPVRVGTSMVDMGAGMWAAMGVLSALQNRNRTGKGGRIDTSLYETALGWMTYHATGFQAEQVIPQRVGSSGPGMTPYQAYKCEDDYLIIAAPNDRMFKRLNDVLGHPEWTDDPRFASNPLRWDHKELLCEMIESVTTTKPRQHWQDALGKVGIPNAPLQNIKEVLEHPQTEAIGIVQETDDGRFKLMGMPLLFDGVRPKQKTGSPELGEHTEEIFGRKP
ncbi:MAG: CoA transferase [Alphaproteobacteria bacterium]|nr:CoA transferase [Alphaproteobacteria bacterium]